MINDYNMGSQITKAQSTLYLILPTSRLRIPPSRVQPIMEIGPWMSLPWWIDRYLTLTWHLYLASLFLLYRVHRVVLLHHGVDLLGVDDLYSRWIYFCRWLNLLFHVLLCMRLVLVILYLVASGWCRPKSPYFWVWFGIHIQQYTFFLFHVPMEFYDGRSPGKFGGLWINIYKWSTPAAFCDVRQSLESYVARIFGSLSIYMVKKYELCIVWMTSVEFLRSIYCLKGYGSKRFVGLVLTFRCFLLFKHFPS